MTYIGSGDFPGSQWEEDQLMGEYNIFEDVEVAQSSPIPN